MKTRLIKSYIIISAIFFFSGCLFSNPAERIAYGRLSQGIIDGKIHKGMTVNAVIESVGSPSEKKSPTVYNDVKNQILIYKSSSNYSNSSIYYLYFKNDELIDWELYK